MANLLTRLLEPSANGPEIAKIAADMLNVRVSSTTLKKEIEEHPDYPSLLSLSDVFSSYGIENIGMDCKHDNLEQLPCPFIAVLKGTQNTTINFFTVVKEISDNGINYYDPEKHRWAILSKESFLERREGFVLLMEASDIAGEREYNLKRKEEKRNRITQHLAIYSIPTLMIFMGIWSFVQGGMSVLLPFIFTLLNLAGVGTTILLIWYELDQHNPLLQQICRAGKKVNCGAVLHSDASKIAGISWSAIGLSYFSGLLFLSQLWVTNGNPTVLFTIGWMTILSVPYVFFSIYYQWRVTKQWCALCLFVQALLVLQLATAIIGHWHTLSSFNSINGLLVLQVITAFTIPLIATVILISAFKKVKEGRHTYKKLQKLKHNKQVFEALLTEQKEVVTNPDGLGIVLGNPDARYKIIKVCNPYCGPCAKAHKPMEDLLHNNPNLQMQVVYTATNDDGDTKAPPVKHLLAIAESNDEVLIKKALDDWYLPEEKNYEIFAAKYPMNGELKQQELKVNAMSAWCKKIEVPFTPVFYISLPSSDTRVSKERYYQLPEIYTVNDLKYILSI